LRKINTPSNDTNTTAQKINIPREDGGGRFGNWITLKITRFNPLVQQPRMNTNLQDKAFPFEFAAFKVQNYSDTQFCDA